VEFQGPIVQSVVYSNGSKTVDITYTAVKDIELRNSNGFEVKLSFVSIQMILYLVLRFVVKEKNV
jgi:hypothetical protein